MRFLTKKEKKLLDEKVAKVTPDDEERVVRELPAKLEHVERHDRNHGLRDLLNNVKLLYQMLRDPHYKLAWKTKAIILGGLIYFILPVDATPDFIPFLGYLDDTVVLGYVIKLLREEIDEYKSIIHISAAQR